jgi:hypothetical protein
MLDRKAIQQILACVDYKDWLFHVGRMGDGYYLQLNFLALVSSDSPTQWTSRKWYISPHACKSEVIQTALKAVLTAEEHEARERFLYKGRAIFGPHKDVDALLAVVEQTREDPR